MKRQILLNVVFAAVLLLASYGYARPASHSLGDLAGFQDALRVDGFEVTPGAVVPWNPTAAYCAETPGVDSALYFNIEPYLQVQVPASAEEPETLSGQFRLAPDEAVVLIGLTPPPEKYFSITPYLWSREYPDGSRKTLITSLGDSVNVATVKAIGPTPFNAPVVLIFTPDQTTEDRVREALRRSGYPSAILNTVVFPASMLKLGPSDDADLLVIAFRNAIWKKSIAGSDYVSNPPFKVFRVTPRAGATADPFPVPPLRVRGTGWTEMDLTSRLNDLRQGIVDANPGLYPTDITLIPMCYEGYDLVQRGLEFCGDSRDAFYLGAGIPEYDQINRITLADDEFLMVYGANHVATGKATYMNINVYASETAKLTLGAVDDRKFAETAAPYLPDGDPDANLTYAYKISRNCGGEDHGMDLAVPDDCTRVTLDSGTLLGLFTRIYLEPATGVGPAMPEMLYDRVLKFSPRPTPQ